MKLLGFSHIIGDPVARKKVRQYIVCSLIAIAAMCASFVVGYLWGLTHFYYG